MPSNKNQADKYKNAILYFVKYCNNSYLGVTKLNKLLYYLDFISYRDRKKTVTGDVYLSLQYGPVPQSIDTMLHDLKSNNKLQIESVTYKDGEKKKFINLNDPSMQVFDKYETKLLKKICEEFNL